MPFGEERDRKGRTYYPKLGTPQPSSDPLAGAENEEPPHIAFGKAILNASAKRVGACALGKNCGIADGVFYQPGMCSISGCPRAQLSWCERPAK